ncbi:DUF4192 domain-containing protein [Streptomyces sp. NL15-2K]|uniref:DUF4192 domain-containing protein n=1 Tax=Streptomyces sp. NL15-2K TaxID=376149 RepID=UPI000F56C018|nr:MULTISPECIES: DUF4192 domain-containing protein [Actinomycetes]WKX13180.1 DUF4192 family protein [Kutzneria buriramensis]GCB45481.1 hypothetical protein SNL152K_2771 [Streptomyces sp. NL15-2K]
MTNHSETTGSSENGDIGGRDGYETHDGPGSGSASGRPGVADEHVECVTYDAEGGDHQVTLRTPAELADALPYLLGYRPEDSIVLVALHDRGGRGRFGGRARLGIPTSEDDWASAARQLAHGLVTGSERRGAKPEQIVAYVCQEPAKGETGQQVMRRLAQLAGLLRTECGRLDVPVIEALCISEGRFWSYCCPSEGCCPPDGLPMGLPGTSVLAAAATYAGLQVRGTLRELRARLLPWETAAALEQELVLDTTSMTQVPKMLDAAGRADVAEEALQLAERVMTRLAEAAPVSGALEADLRDDELLGHEEAAMLILALQDRSTRDRAAEWMEADEAGPALRLWRALARRCVGPYGEHAAAPLTLVGWVAWSSGDDIEAREALAMALGADPDYLFARLLHQACNEGLDPESIRRCLRTEREQRAARSGPEGAEREVAESETVASGQAAAVVSTRQEAGAPTQQDEGGVGVGGEQPVSAPGTSRRRRRTRSSGGPDGRPRSGEPGGRPSGTDESHARTRPAAGMRPGVTRACRTRPRPSGAEGGRPRPSSNAGVPRRGSGPGAARPGGDATGEK